MPLVGPDGQPQKPSTAASTTVPDSEVSSTVMANNVLSFPARPDPGAAGPTMAGRFSRAIFQIGARRFVLEFRTSVTELHPVDTPAAHISQTYLIALGPHARAVANQVVAGYRLDDHGA